MADLLLEAFQKVEPLVLDAQFDYPSILKVWREYDFTSQGMDRALNQKNVALQLSFEEGPTLRRLNRETPFGVLFEMFRMNLPVDYPRAVSLLGAETVEDWLRVGLLIRDQSKVQSPFNIRIYEGLYCFGDAGLSVYSNENLVLGINPTALITATVMIRQPVESALDLCTGNGFLALLASRFAKRVVGTDISLRCLNLARFNAAINGIQNIEWRQGSWFSPVAGEKFDLITCNPPFVLSPETKYVFRDANVGGEGITAQLSQSYPAYLRQNGFGVLIGNWATKPKGDWAEPPRRWFNQKKVDVALLRGSKEDAQDYAYHWLNPHYVGRRTELEKAVDRWLEHFREQQIEEISFAAILIRQRDAEQHGFVTYEVSRDEARHMPCSEQMLHIFHTFDLLNNNQDNARLLALRLVPSPSVMVEQQMSFVDGMFQFRQAKIYTTKGLQFEDILDANELAYFGLFDGQRTIQEVIQEMAAALEQPFDAVLKPGLEMAQRWLFRSYLAPSEGWN